MNYTWLLISLTYLVIVNTNKIRFRSALEAFTNLGVRQSYWLKTYLNNHPNPSSNLSGCEELFHNKSKKLYLSRSIMESCKDDLIGVRMIDTIVSNNITVCYIRFNLRYNYMNDKVCLTTQLLTDYGFINLKPKTSKDIKIGYITDFDQDSDGQYLMDICLKYQYNPGDLVSRDLCINPISMGGDFPFNITKTSCDTDITNVANGTVKLRDLDKIFRRTDGIKTRIINEDKLGCKAGEICESEVINANTFVIETTNDEQHLQTSMQLAFTNDVTNFDSYCCSPNVTVGNYTKEPICYKRKEYFEGSSYKYLTIQEKDKMKYKSLGTNTTVCQKGDCKGTTRFCSVFGCSGTNSSYPALHERILYH